MADSPLALWKLGEIDRRRDLDERTCQKCTKSCRRPPRRSPSSPRDDPAWRCDGDGCEVDAVEVIRQGATVWPWHTDLHLVGDIEQPDRAVLAHRGDELNSTDDLRLEVAPRVAKLPQGPYLIAFVEWVHVESPVGLPIPNRQAVTLRLSRPPELGRSARCTRSEMPSRWLDGRRASERRRL